MLPFSRHRLPPGAQAGRRDDRGMVTAEAAVALPVLLVALVFSVWALACVTAQLRCVDAARAAARLAARGEAPQAVLAVGRAIAPPGALVQSQERGEHVVVVVRAAVHPFGPALRGLPAVAVQARAVALREDSLDAGPGRLR